MPAKKTHEQFMADFKSRQPELFTKYTILGEYIRADINILMRCNECGLTSESPPTKLFAGNGCVCGRKLNNEKYFERLFKSKPEYQSKFDYTGSNITGTNSYLIFTCRDCGYVCKTQTAATHYNGNGCPSCNNRPKYSKDLLIKKSAEKYGSIFDFTNTVDFDKATDEIVIGCPRHGYVVTTAQSHLKTKKGCPKCQRYDAAEITDKFYTNPNNSHISFVDIEKDLEGDVKVRFIRMHCKDHGEYSTRLSAVLKGNGCLKCYHDRSEGTYNMTSAERYKETYLEKPLDIYVLYIRDLGMYKIGLTKNISHRVSHLRNEVRSEIDILYRGLTNAFDAINLEKSLLESLKAFKGKSAVKFGGYTELVVLPDEIASDLIEYLATVTKEYYD